MPVRGGNGMNFGRAMVAVIIALTCASLSIFGCAGELGAPANNSDSTVQPSFDPIRITSSQVLPAGETGIAYSTTLTATGGDPMQPIVWTLVTGQMPDGLSLTGGVRNASGAGEALLAGLPTTAGQYSFEIRASEDANGSAATQRSAATSPATMQFSMSVTSQVPATPLVITRDPLLVPLKKAIVNENYTNFNEAITASGGTGAYQWTLSGPASAWMSIDANGMLGGVPPASSGDTTGQVTVTVGDGVSASASANYSLQIVYPQLAFDLASMVFPTATVGVYYEHTVTAQGGTNGDYIWGWVLEAAGPAIPPGCHFGPLATVVSGVGESPRGTPSITIRGVPTADGTYWTAIEVGDTFGWLLGAQAGFPVLEHYASNYSVRILVHPAPANQPVIATSSNLMPAVQGAFYSTDITVSGGSGTGYIWELKDGQLPQGLALTTVNGASAVISGTPASLTFAPVEFTLQVTDSAGVSVARRFSLSVAAAGSMLTISAVYDAAGALLAPFVLPVARAEESYFASYEAQGGTPPYIWTFGTSGAPAWMTIDANTGELGGTPPLPNPLPATLDVEEPVEVLVTDLAGNTASVSANLTTEVWPDISTASTLPDAPAEEHFSQTITAASILPGEDLGWYILSAPAWVTLYDAVSTDDICELSGTPPVSAVGQTLPIEIRLMSRYVFSAGGFTRFADTTFNLTVLPSANALAIVTATLPDGIDSEFYFGQLESTGGGAARTWSVPASSLPAGVMLNSATGELYGRCNPGTGAAGSGTSYVFTVTLTSLGETDTQQLTLHVAPKAASGAIVAVAGSTSGVHPWVNLRDGGSALVGGFDQCCGMVFDAAGNMYVCDRLHGRIRKVSTNGVITTIAGGGTRSGASGFGGLATDAFLDAPTDLALDPSGNIYFAELTSGRVCKIAASTGILTHVATLQAPGLAIICGLAINDAGTTLYVPVLTGATVYSIDLTNVFVYSGMTYYNYQMFAGTGTPGDSGDSGPANQAQLGFPIDAAVYGNKLYIADTGGSGGNGNIRVVDISTSTISTFAATGACPWAMWSIAVDRTGVIYCGCEDIASITGYVAVVSGGAAGFSTIASLNPLSLEIYIAFDAQNNAYVGDAYNNKIVKLVH